MTKYIIVILLFVSPILFAQNNSQNIRGVVTDKLSQTTLPGANIVILNISETKGTTSDIKGNYVLNGLAPDRYEIKATFMGYKDVIIPNVVVLSGKETILDIAMEENVINLKEVVVKGNKIGLNGRLETRFQDKLFCVWILPF